MTDRVHAALDGELRREALTDEEQARLISMEEAVTGIADELRSVGTPDLSSAVMARVRQTRPARSPWKRAIDWFWAPRTLALTLRPAHAFGGLAAVAVLVLATAPAVDHGVPVEVAAAEDAPAEAATLYVQFRFEASGASHVELAGSFTGWEPGYELDESAPGVWSVLVPLRPGVHDYTFVVDGEEWMIDPHAPRVSDSFGGTNNRLFLPAPADAA